jgi:flagellar biosynthetic protein FliR
MEIIGPYITNFLFILLRVGIVMSMLPFFGSKNFPAQFKIGLVIAITLVLTPVIDVKVVRADIPFLVMRELIMGIALGLVTRLVFLAVETAGQVMSNAMGLSLASVFNPEIGQSTEIAQVYGIITMLLFLAMDAHHDLIYIFVRSYEWLPAGHIAIENIAAEVISTSGLIFVMAVKISAPVVIAMLISSLILGFLYKAAPQMNIFFIGYPIYIFIGFIVILTSMPVMVPVIGNYFSVMKDEMARIIALARG